MRTVTGSAAVALFFAAVAGAAQTPPLIRQLGRVEQTSTDSLASVAAALSMPGGRVLVNDITGRRLLLFDSTLTHATVVADTTSATADAYGTRPGTLIRYRGDSALYIDIGSVSMLVIGPKGDIARIMAVPRPSDAQNLIGSIFGTPGFDGTGRLVYYGHGGLGGGSIGLCCLGSMPANAGFATQFAGVSDSAILVRADLATRTIDTVATIKTIKVKVEFVADQQGMLAAIQTTRYPLPIVDDWIVMPDGSLAIVRGRDFHVDWLSADGKWTSTSKISFDWQHIDDAQKQALIDSAAKANEAQAERFAAAQSTPTGGAGAAGGGRGSGGRGGGTGAGSGGRGTGQPIPNVEVRPAVNDLPDYAPAFARGAVVADADDNLWIQTSTIADGRPVYDIVNRRGELFDRVQLPPFRTIAGFGPGVVYLAVKDSAGVVHIEKVRVK